MKRLTLHTYILLTAVGISAGAENPNRFAGVWKMNPKESKFSENAACQSETVTVAADGRVSIEQVDSKGKRLSWSYKPEAAGKAASIEGLERASRVTSYRTESTDTEVFDWNGWKMTGHGVLSMDGKRMTYTLTGKDDQGRPFHNLMIFEKEQGGEGRNRFAGVWKMNPKESKFSENAACQSETVTVAADGRVSIEQVDSKGKRLSWSYKPEAAGKAASIEGLERASRVTSYRTESTDTEVFDWNGWKMTGHGVLSMDGKRMTYTLTGKDDQGRPFHNLMIFEKEE